MVARVRLAGLLVLPALLVGAPAGLLAQAGPVAAGSAGSPVAWVMPSTVRIPSWSEPGHRTATSIEALRGETESFQVAVRAVGGSLSGVSLTVSPLVGPGGSRIGGRSIALFREQYVRVPHHSPAWSGRPIAWPSFPDALVPFIDPVTGRRPDRGARVPAAPFEVVAGHVQPVWVDVTVPRSATPGRYTGTWTVTSGHGSRHGTVALQVRDATLPATPTAGSRFGIRQIGNRRPAVEDLLLRYRVQPNPVEAAREPALGLRSVDLRLSSGADALNCDMTGPPSVATVRAAMARHPESTELYDYTADEVTHCPGVVEQLLNWARVLHAAGVDQMVTVVPRPELMDDGTGRPVVDIWVMTPWQLRLLDPAVRQQIEAAGGRVWSYQALVQGRRTPSWELDFPVTNYRVLGGFLNASQDVDGLLYWAVDQPQRDPWRDPTYAYPTSCCYPGDGTLVYPGRPAGVVGVVPSIRLAMVRDGMDDYDYVSMLRARGQAAQVDALLAPAATSWWDWTSDGRVLADVRHRLADLLEAPVPAG
ncbi:MAG TPA: glycoside hydrolase domain-containing protein [Actinomycetes bacterium]|jgi:hypothetical protein|nr:glycoside hydrolase domain-containing protein [Actinomycetes bacterium]